MSKKILIGVFLLIAGISYSQTYGLDGLGTKFYQMEGCKKLSNNQPCDSCFMITRGLNGKLQRCLHISELRSLLSSGGGGLYGNDTVYLVNNSNGSYTLVNEAGTNYLFGYKFVQSGDTLFLTDQDGTKADTAIFSGLGGDGNGFYGGNFGNGGDNTIPDQTLSNLPRTSTYALGYFSGFPGTDPSNRGLLLDSRVLLINGDSTNNITSYVEVGESQIQQQVSDGTFAANSLLSEQQILMTYTDGTENQTYRLDKDSILIQSSNTIDIEAPGIVLNDLSGTLTGDAGYVWKSNGYTGYWGIDSLGSSVVADGLYNDIEVTNSGQDWEVRDDSISFNKLRNIGTDRLIGRDSTGTGNAHEITVNSTLEFTGTNSIQRAALTGDVTAPAGSNVTTIANDAVTNAKLANMATQTIKGRNTAGTGDPEDLSIATVKSMLSLTTNLLNTSGNVITSTVGGATDTALAVTILNTNLSGNSITTNVNNVTDTSLVVGSVVVNFDGNATLTTSVNGVSDTCDISAITGGTTNNIVTNGNIITSTVNGVSDTTEAIRTNSLTFSSDDLTSIVNGVSSNSIDLSGYLDNTDDQKIDTFTRSNDTIFLSLEDDAEARKFIVLPAVAGTTNVIELNGNILTSNVNGVIDTTVTILTNDLSSSGNTMTSTINGVADSAPMINTVTNGVVGNTLTTSVNGVPASTSVILKDSLELSGNIMQLMVNGIYDTSLVIGSNVLSYQDPILTSTINGVTDTAYLQINGNPFDKNGFYSGNGGNGGDGNIPNNTYSQLLYDRNFALGYFPNFPSTGDPHDHGIYFDDGLTFFAFDSINEVNTYSKVVDGLISSQIVDANDIDNTTEEFFAIDKWYILCANNTASSTIEMVPDSMVSIAPINKWLGEKVIIDDLSGTGEGNHDDVWVSGGIGEGGYWEAFEELLEEFLQDTLSLSGNTMTMNVNGVTDTSLVIGELDVTSSTNTLTVEVNNVSDNASIINSNVLNLSGNQLTETINGVSDTSLVIGEVNANLSGNSITVNVNDVTDTTLVVGEVNLNLSGNVLTTNTNDVTDTSLVIGNVTTSYSGGIITTSVNGVSDTALIVSGTIGNLLDGGNTDGQIISYGTVDNFAAEIEVEDTVYQSIGTDGNVTFSNTVANNTTATNDLLNFNQRSHGTPGIGFGIEQMYRLESSTTNDQDAGAFSVNWEVATHSGREGNMKWSLGDNAGALTTTMKLDRTTSTGLLSLGTTTPLLMTISTISGQADGGLVITGGDAVGDSLVFKPTSANATDAQGAFVFNGDNNGGTNLMTIRNNGNIGIGTAIPTAKMHVSTAVSSDPSVNLDDLDNVHAFTGIGGVFANNTVNTNLAIAPNSTTQGGIVLAGFRENDGISFSLQGHQNSTTPTTACVTIDGWKTNGTTGRTGLSASTETILDIRGGTTTMLRVLGDGKLGVGTTSPTAFVHIKAGTTAANTAPQKFNDGSVMTSSEEGSVEYDSSFYFTNEQRIRFGAGGTIKYHLTDANNVGTGETDLYSYTTAAGTLGRLGETIEAKYGGVFNDATATSQLKVYFAGNLIGDTGALTVTTGSWDISVVVIRTSSTTARCLVTIMTPTGTPVTYVNETDLTGLNLGTTNILKITGTASGATGGNGDITSKLGSIKWFPAGIN